MLSPRASARSPAAIRASVVLASAVCISLPAAAQSPPYGSISPSGGTYDAGTQVQVHIEFCSPSSFFDAYGWVWLNGSFIGNTQPGSNPSCSDFQSGDFTITIAQGANTVSAQVNDNIGTAYVEATYTGNPPPPPPPPPPPSPPVVTPDGASAGPYLAGSNQSRDFTVKNIGEASATFTISCSPLTQIACASINPTSVQLAPSQTAGVSVTFTTPPSGPQTLALRATGAGGSDDGSYNVQVSQPPPGTAPIVVIKPPTHVRLGNTLTVTIDWCGFPPTWYDPATRVIKLNGQDIANLFTTQFVFDAACRLPGEIADEIYERSTGVVTLGNGDNTLYAEIRSTTNYVGAAQEIYMRPDPFRSVAVTSDNQYAEVRPSGAGLTQRFTIWNTAPVTDTFSLAGACSGAATPANCLSSPTSVVLNAGASATATVTYNSGSTVGATGLVWLKAWRTVASSVRDSGWTEITVTAAPASGVVLIQTPDVLERDLCVTIAAGANAAYECGDLRMAHALPSIRTRNTPRTPTLVYNSQHASPFPLVAANVTLPSIPDSVTAVLRIGGVIFARGKWLGNQWQLGWGNRVAVGFAADTFSTRNYTYTLEVTRWSGSSGTNVGTPTGQLLIVNRRTSPFGAGWWMAGLEQLLFPPDGSRFWVGGDGSVRRYVAAGSNIWVAPNVDRPDTLKWNATLSRYVRYLRNGLQVRFTSAGRHVETVNRLGHVTRFTYDASARLDSLVLPPIVTPLKAFLFRYKASTSRLDSVIAPALGATGRATKVTISGSRITAIRDPDLNAVSFSYGAGADSNRIVSRTNRRGYATRYGFEPASKRLAADSIPLTSTTYAISSFQVGETRGFSPTGGSGTAWRADTVYSRLDGPRTDVSDITKFWVNAYGAPTRVRNALGRETRVVYNATWPAVAARTVAPNQFETKAFYNSRGLPDSTVALNPLGTGANATTTYKWHVTWDMAVAVRSPLGIVDTVTYDAATGNRLWQRHGSNGAVSFTYHPSGAGAGQLASMTAPLTPPEYLTYNALGNLSKTQSPIGFTTVIIGDGLGRDSIVYSPIDSATGRDSASVIATGSWSRVLYDLQDRVIASTSWGPARNGVAGTNAPADSVRVETQFDAEGNAPAIIRRFQSNGGNLALQSTSSFDRANRVEWQFSPSGGTETFAYDPAGNLTSTLSARNHTVTAGYDALNRVTQRVVPQVNYSDISCYGFIPFWVGCFFDFPTRGGPGVCLRADTAQFSYDHVGNMTRADNWAALVRRTYTPSGFLKSDTLRTRTYYYASDQPCEPPVPPNAALGWNNHVYPLRYDYDLDGRRIKLWHPDLVDPCGGQCTQDYFYGAQSGLLNSLTDALGNTVYLGYDAAARRYSTLYPGNWQETVTYDGESRVTRRQVSAPGASYWIDDQMAYDALGRVRTGTDAGTHSIDTYYGPLGAVIGTVGMTGPGQGTEEFVVNGLGNRIWRRQLNLRPPPHVDEHGIRVFEYDNAARLVTMRDTVAQGCQGCDPYKYREDHQYDASGNEHLRWSDEWDVQSGGGSVYDQAVSYYGADQKLRVFNRVIGIDSMSNDVTPGRRGVYEEYRYDALGRRVLKRTRHDSTCPTNDGECASLAERTIWDGDQILYEIRSHGHDTVYAYLLDNDQDYSTSTEAYAFGRVVYTHGGGIDQPLGIIRMGMVQQPDPWVVFPHANWRGSVEGGSNVNGTVCWGTGGGCLIPWPGRGTTADGELAQPSQQLMWFGNLLSGKTDGSGLQYMRNRYYDPKSGRFTQEDPIGLAGGLNLYGFAAGDPVNFSDPFGLCPDSLKSKGSCPDEAKLSQGPVEALGVTLTFATPFGGGTVTVGVYHTEGGGTGEFLTFGSAGGLDIDVGVNRIVSESMGAFGGDSHGGCGGGLYANGCIYGNPSGETSSGGASVGPIPWFLPTGQAGSVTTVHTKPRPSTPVPCRHPKFCYR